LKIKFPSYAAELKRTGVTLRLLWEEYLQENPAESCHPFRIKPAGAIRFYPAT